MAPIWDEADRLRLLLCSLNLNIVGSAEPSWRVTDRRSFLLKGAAVGAGAIGASRLLHGSPSRYVAAATKLRVQGCE